MAKERVKLSDVIREAVRTAKSRGLSGAAICRGTGIDPAALSRFMADKPGGLSLTRLDAVADFLELRIVAEGPAKRLPRGEPPRKPKAKKGR